MADTVTTTLGLTKPEVGASEDSWGEKINTNFDLVDDALDGTTAVSLDINGGTIDGAVIGGATPAAGTFTTLTANTSIGGTLSTAAQPNVTSVGTLTGLTVSGSTSLAGASTSADITFGDNDKAIFGAGSDLQIYHDTLNSVIADAGTGNLVIAADDFRLTNSTQTANMIKADEGGAVTLTHNGGNKLATTSTGIDVTGTVTADGLTVQTVQGNIEIANSSAIIDMQRAGTNYIYASDASGNLRLGSGGLFNRINIANSGDISFYEDTGTTPKFFWDASAESLGIGTTSPSKELHVMGASHPEIRLQNTSNNYALDLKVNNTVGEVKASSDMAFLPGGSEAIRITSSGNVGIGTSSPAYLLHVAGTSIVPTVFTMEQTDTTLAIDQAVGLIAFKQNDLGSGAGIAAQFGAFAEGNNGEVGLRLYTGSGNTNTERMRIDSSGKVGIGTSSPSRRLDVRSGSFNSAVAQFTGANDGRGLLVSTFARASNDDSVDYDTPFGGHHTFSSSGSEKVRITNTGNVGIGTSSPQRNLQVGEYGTGSSTIAIASATNGYGYVVFGDSVAGDGVYRGAITYAHPNDAMLFNTAATEAMRIDSSGNLLVGTTDTDPANSNVNGTAIGAANYFSMTRTNGSPMILNRKSSDGDIALFRKDGSTVGSIGTASGVAQYSGSSKASFGAGDVGLFANPDNDALYPVFQTTLTGRDNAIDLGIPTNRFDDIYATNGTIQTSDRNEKQDIEALSDAEQRVAVACKGLLRKFRWIDAVAEKGDDARIHFGIIAQDLQDAFAAEGLDAGRYAMFISSTWTDEETGEERTRMGVRYPELLAFIIAAI